MPRKKRNVTVEVFNRRKRVEQYLRRGVTNRDQIAAALGVTRSVMNEDVKAVMRDWVRYQPKTTKYLRARAVAVLEGVIADAANSFAKSMTATEEVRYEERICDVCQGAKYSSVDGQCQKCEGNGTITESTITVKERIGDPAFLKVIADARKEISKLQGIYPERSSKVEVSGSVTQIGLLGVLPGNNPYTTLSPEKLLEARTMLAELLAPKRDAGLVIEAKKVEDATGH